MKYNTLVAKKYNILVVDDEPDNLLLLERVLRRDYNLFTANSGAEALEILETMDVDMIISDQRMPNMTGAELLGKAYERTPDQVRILLTAYSDVKDIVAAINAGHIYQYLSKPWDPDDLKLTVRRSLESYQLTLDNRTLMTRYRNDEAELLGLFQRLVTRLEGRSPYTRDHARRVQHYASMLGRDLGFFDEELSQLDVMAQLHRLGLLVESDAQLASALEQIDPNQRLAYSPHAAVTEELLVGLPFFVRAIPLLGWLAEPVDGSGVRGQAGMEVPLLARVMQVVIAFDDLVVGRPGVEPLEPALALAAIKEQAGRAFDPMIVERFARLLAANPDLVACRS